MTRLAKYAWFVLLFNIIVILWGAYVRATGSGAGCGSHWPLCNGEVLPRAPQIETVIEFAHRATSGIAFILVLILLVLVFRTYPKGHNLRLGASLSMFFMVAEALVGAGLVLFKWVADDASSGRVFSIVVHLINTFLLLAALTLTAWWLSGGKPVRLRQAGSHLWWAIIAMLGTIVIGVSGALTALGDTLFPVSSLAEGIQQDFSPTVHFLVRLRILHPSIAVLVGFYLIVFGGIVLARNQAQWAQRFGRTLIILILIQFAAGLINVYLLAPVWLQIVHLLLADLIWITLILFSAVHFADEEGREVDDNNRSSLSYAEGS
jgi:heme A synthase